MKVNLEYEVLVSYLTLLTYEVLKSNSYSFLVKYFQHSCLFLLPHNRLIILRTFLLSRKQITAGEAVGRKMYTKYISYFRELSEPSDICKASSRNTS